LGAKCGTIKTTRETSLRLSLLKPLAQNFNVFKIFALELYLSWGDYFFCLNKYDSKYDHTEYEIIQSHNIPSFLSLFKKEQRAKGKKGISATTAEKLCLSVSEKSSTTIF
jgi:hypothetical protein